MALSPGDPNSYSRPDLAKIKHIHLDLDLDFNKQMLQGNVILTVSRESDEVEEVVLDVRGLDINGVVDEETGSVLRHDASVSSNVGQKLTVQLPATTQSKIRIDYSTSPQSSALQWLKPEQTAGKTHPYMFSQCQAIHCRAMLPCQDTPSVKQTYSAVITAPPGITVLMSAVREGDAVELEDGRQRFTFNQTVPIMSYLIALAAGHVESRRIGPRSHVWSEAAFVDQAASDFSETEHMLQTAEELSGPYVWGIYDILVLPPSFPFGGMENPCLTFATPTLLSGDKSNADVIAHEIAHSWTGNLVSNVNFEHFWLNEGFTTFVERKIVGRLHGEPSRHFNAILRWSELEETVHKTLGATSPFTALIPRLAGIDPDDAFSLIPYEKGATFLWYLEQLVGGAGVFEPFLRAYYQNFQYKSINSDDFKAFFLNYFKTIEDIKSIDWETWFHKPGMPPYTPQFNDALAKASWDLAEQWQAWDVVSDFNHSSFTSFSAGQKQEFLTSLYKGDALSPMKLQKMQSLYDLDNSPNVEILFRWLRLGIKSKWEPAVPRALDLATKQGRMKFVRPLFRDLYAWEDQRAKAIETFKKHRSSMMHVCSEMVAKDLQL